jgi:hypothetical protein
MSKTKKLKCYVLMVSEQFSKKHKRAGEPTEFVEKVERKEKIHTIRANYELWAKRFEKIKNGEAYLSIRIWTALPYRSKQKEVFRLDKSDGIGIECLDVLPFGNHVEKSAWIDESELAKNDGLTYDDFKEWFKSYDSETMVIIHFTNFRYAIHR